MEFLIFAIVAFIVFIAAVISGMKEAEKKQAEEKNIASHPVRIQREGKFVKPECSINDTLIDFEVKGVFYRDKDAIERAARLYINEPLILEVEPGNIRDKNAVKVLTEDKIHIGYLPKDIASYVHFRLDKVITCYAKSISDNDVPYIYASFVFKGKDNVLFYNRVLNDFRVREEIEERIPELKELDVFPEKQLEPLSHLLVKYPNEFFVEYKYLLALRWCQKHDEVLKQIEIMASKYPSILELNDIKEIVLFTECDKKREEERLHFEKVQAMHYEAKGYFDSGNYAEALPLFMESLEQGSSYQQALRFVCICYEKLGQVENIKPFCIKMKEKEWVTNHTKMQMDKFIKKYS